MNMTYARWNLARWTLYSNVRHYAYIDQREPTDVIIEAVSAIAESSEAVTSPDTFDILRSFLKYASAVPGILMSKLLDLIMSGFAAEVDAAAHDIDHEDQHTCATHKVPIEMYAFLLNWSAHSAENVPVPDEDAPIAVPAKPRRGRGGKAAQPRAAAKNRMAEWSWKDQIVHVLTLISKVLKLKTSKIWTVSGERDTFIGYVASQAIVTGYLMPFMGRQVSHCSRIPHHGECGVHEVP